MRSLARAIDRFCIKHPRFGIPNLMLYIIIGNAVLYVFCLMDTTNTLMDLLSFSPADILRGQVWRLVTFVFMPQYSTANSFFWMIIFLYLYYFIGTTLERQWGTAKFTLYYLSCMLLLVITGFIFYFASRYGFLVVAFVRPYYINLTLFFIFATLYPDAQMRFMMIIPVKAWWLGLGSGIYFLYEVLWRYRAFFPVNLVPLATVVVFLVFCGSYLLDYMGVQNRATGKTAINFKRAAKKVNKETKSKPYNRKCAVCGKTDTDYPDLEFRYCSRCEGYHCFCLDHIDNHVHFDK